MEIKCGVSPRQAGNLCANLEQVYDWIIEESAGSTSVPIGSLPIPLPAGATNVVATCRLTDSLGVPLPTNYLVNVVETEPRYDRQFEVNGALVTLQSVSYTKTLYATMTCTGVDPATGTQFLITSNPLPFTFLESVFLCAPPGTSLVVRISSSSGMATVRRDEGGVITRFGVNIFVCQSIQTVAPVTVEIAAGACTPRQGIEEHCGSPVVPPNCPVVFPGT